MKNATTNVSSGFITFSSSFTLQWKMHQQTFHQTLSLKCTSLWLSFRFNNVKPGYLYTSTSWLRVLLRCSSFLFALKLLELFPLIPQTLAMIFKFLFFFCFFVFFVCLFLNQNWATMWKKTACFLQYMCVASLDQQNHRINTRGSSLALEIYNTRTTTKTRVAYSNSHLACM